MGDSLGETQRRGFDPFDPIVRRPPDQGFATLDMGVPDEHLPFLEIELPFLDGKGVDLQPLLPIDPPGCFKVRRSAFAVEML